MTDKYEAPRAVHLNDADRAFGACSPYGSTPVSYRGDGSEAGCGVGSGVAGICVTGKSAEGGCYAGAV